jgi:hypothetical protein
VSNSTDLPRLIPRREVLAFIALTGDEASMPHTIRFREYRGGDRDWHVVDLDVDGEAAVRFWAGVFGHPEHHFRRSEHTRADGTRWTNYSSSNAGWRGFTTEVEAQVDEHEITDAPLDDATCARLAEIASPSPEVRS